MNLESDLWHKLKHFCFRGDNLKLPDGVWSDLCHIDGIPSPGERHVVGVDQVLAPGVHDGVLVGQVHGHTLQF